MCKEFGMGKTQAEAKNDAPTHCFLTTRPKRLRCQVHSTTETIPRITYVYWEAFAFGIRVLKRALG